MKNIFRTLIQDYKQILSKKGNGRGHILEVLSIKYSIPDHTEKNTTWLFPSLVRVLQEKKKSIVMYVSFNFLVNTIQLQVSPSSVFVFGGFKKKKNRKTHKQTNRKTFFLLLLQQHSFSLLLIVCLGNGSVGQQQQPSRSSKQKKGQTESTRQSHTRQYHVHFLTAT